MDFHPKSSSPQLKMIILIFMLGLTWGIGQVPPVVENTWILRNVIDSLDKLSLQLKEFEEKVEAKFEGLQQCSTEAQLSQFQELVFKDDCVEGSHTCGDMSTCTDYFNWYECSCLPGYSGDGITCQDVDECSENNNICGDHGTCHNNPGSYTCICDKNFRYVGNICQDVNECLDDEAFQCEENEDCFNTEGGYDCQCQEGYYREGNTCQASLYLEELGYISPIIDQHGSWNDVKTKCQAEGKRLLEGIKYKHLQLLANHFYSVSSYHSFWIGMKDSRWITSGEEVTDDLWYPGYPNDGNDDGCVYISTNPSYLGLRDYTCSGTAYALCQSLPPY